MSEMNEKMQRTKSRVRVSVTYAAMLFLFLGGALFIMFLIWTRRLTEAFQLFNTLLPVAAAIVSFWFAGRSSSPEQRDK